MTLPCFVEPSVPSRAYVRFRFVSLQAVPGLACSSSATSLESDGAEGVCQWSSTLPKWAGAMCAAACMEHMCVVCRSGREPRCAAHAAAEAQVHSRCKGVNRGKSAVAARARDGEAMAGSPNNEFVIRPCCVLVLVFNVFREPVK